MVALSAVSLLAAFCAFVYVICMRFFLIGLLSIVPQIIIPYGAVLAGPKARGKVMGTLLRRFYSWDFAFSDGIWYCCQSFLADDLFILWSEFLHFCFTGKCRSVQQSSTAFHTLIHLKVCRVVASQR